MGRFGFMRSTSPRAAKPRLDMALHWASLQQFRLSRLAEAGRQRATTGLAAAGRDVYELHSNGEIWRSLGEPCDGDNCPSWQRLDRNAAATAIAASGRELYQLHKGGEIWRSLGEPCGAEHLERAKARRYCVWL